MVFVVDSECYMYRRMSMKKARLSHKRISTTLFSRFDDFHAKWLEKCDDAERRRCEDWMLGLNDKEIAESSSKSGDKSSLPVDKTGAGSTSLTNRVTIDEDNKSPYRPYYRYKVEKAKK
jgi:hypothetical protein